MQSRYLLFNLKNGLIHAKIKLPFSSRRHLSIGAAKLFNSNPNNISYERKIEIKPYGKLFLETYWLPVKITHVKSLESYIGIRVITKSSRAQVNDDFSTKIRAEINQNTVHIKSDVKLSEELISLQPRLHLEIPVQYDANIQSFHENDVFLSSLESANIDCCMQNGKIRTENLKCVHLNIMSTNGNVYCNGSVLGNVNIKTAGKGAIRADRLQGSEIRLRTDAGEIEVGSIYAENSTIASDKANVLLSNIHGNSKISVQHGNLKVVGLDGSLTATVFQGNADIKISRLLPNAHATVTANDGNVIVKLPEDMVARLRLEGKDVRIVDAIRGQKITELNNDVIIYEGVLNDAAFGRDPLILASAPMGEVIIRIENWLSDLKLDF